MKKIVKIPVNISRDTDGTHYHYPNGYSAKKINVIGYGGFDGDETTYLVGIVKEEDFNQFIGIDGAIELTKEIASTTVGEWKPPITVINNSSKVIDIVKKIMPIANQVLTQDEIDAIDEDNGESGIVKKVFDINKFI